MHFLLLVPVVVGLLLAIVGFLGMRGRLSQQGFAGVRTAASLRDDQTFRVANRVAGLPVLVGGVVGVLGGAAGLAKPEVALVTGIVGTIGMLLLAVAGGVVGHRAAEAVPAETAGLPEGCRGCACGGCELAKSVGANVAGVGGE